MRINNVDVALSGPPKSRLDMCGSASLTTPSAATATGQAGNDDVEEGNDAIDNGGEDGANGVDNGHKAISDGGEDGFDLLQKVSVSMGCFLRKID